MTQTIDELLEEIAVLRAENAALKPAAEELERLHAILDVSPDSILVFGPDLQLRYTSPAFRTAMGYGDNELQGPRAFEIIHPDDRAAVLGVLVATVNEGERGEIVESSFRTRHASGEWRLVEAHTRAFFDATGSRDGAVVTLRNVTARRQAERLRQGEDLLSLTYDSALIGIAVADDDGTLVRANATFCATFGYTEEELTGKSFLTLVPEHLHADGRAFFERLTDDGATPSYEWTGLHRDGSRRSLTGSANTFTRADGRRYVVAAVGDITERRVAERASREADAMYRTLVEQAADPIVILQDGVTVYRNPVWEKMLGFSTEETAGRTFLDFVVPEHRERLRENYARRLRGEGSEEAVELDVIARDGSRIAIESRAQDIEYRGRPATMVVLRDISARKKAEEQTNRLASIVKAAPQAIIFYDRAANVLSWNEGAEQIYGYTPQEVIGQPGSLLLPPGREREMDSRWPAVLGGQSIVEFETQRRKKDGAVVDVSLTFFPLRDGEGNVLGGASIAVDISARKQAEDTNARLAAVVETSPSAVIVVDPTTAVVGWNSSAERLFGYTAEEMMGVVPLAIVPDDRRQELGDLWRRAFTGEPVQNHETQRLTKDGRRIDVSVTVFLLKNRDGKPEGMASIMTDITARKRAEEDLRLNDEGFRALFASNPQPMWVFDSVTYQIVEVNDAAVAHYGYSREEFLSMKVTDIRPPEERARFESHARGGYQTDEADQEWAHLTKDGRTIWVRARGNGLMFNGRPARLVSIEDVTERRSREDAIARLASIVDSAPVAIIGSDLERNITSWNGGAERLYGYRAEEMMGSPGVRLLPPGQADDMTKPWTKVLRGGEPIPEFETRRLTNDGRVVEVAISIFPIRDGTGRLVGGASIAVDITGRKRLEQQLLQSQKMEGIGRLAGGIAHDFNNLLTAIISYSEFARGSMSEHDERHEDIGEVLKAAHRASELTRQLLAFARRQVVEPKVLNLNDLLMSTDRLLRRLIGEDIELVTLPAPGLSPVRIDPGQFEQILVNLAVNARDAMPTGGKLTLLTADLPPGSAVPGHPEVASHPYVMVAVTDTGTGMTRETMEHIFEPFYTTKEVGKGTGLGLATCYGIVEQAGGFIVAESEPGHGTTFRVYLPALVGEAVPGHRVEPETVESAGSETILLVEDERQVRHMAERVLRIRGYTVVAAGSADEALAFAQGFDGVIDLLVTDVVMPRVSGVQLAETMRELRPGLPVLFVSGYTEDTIVSHGVVQEGVEFLAKPFTPATLGRRVRDLLDAQPVRV